MEGYEKPKHKMTRRDFLVGATASAAMAAGGAAWGEKMVDSATEDTLSAEEKLSIAQEAIPEGVPVTVRLNEKGEIVYEHVDQETTELVSFLAGKGPVSDSVIARNLRKEMFNLMKLSGQDVAKPENRNLLYQIQSTDDILRLYDRHYRSVSPHKRAEFHDATDYALSRIEQERVIDERIRSQISPELYRALWQIFITCGAPRVELVDTYEERSEGKDNLYGSSDRFLYNGDSGKPLIYIDSTYKSDKMLDNFLQELAHSYSFYSDPEGFHKRLEAKRNAYSQIQYLTGEARRIANRKYYREPGHEEYYAHQIIYPQLVDQIKDHHPTIKDYLESNLDKLQNE